MKMRIKAENLISYKFQVVNRISPSLSVKSNVNVSKIAVIDFRSEMDYRAVSEK